MGRSGCTTVAAMAKPHPDPHRAIATGLEPQPGRHVRQLGMADIHRVGILADNYRVLGYSTLIPLSVRWPLVGVELPSIIGWICFAFAADFLAIAARHDVSFGTNHNGFSSALFS